MRPCCVGVACRFGREWSERFELPVYVENNANAAAIGEYYFGAARDVSDFIYIGGEPGIGGGIVVEGELLRGRSGFAGEIGHMTVVPDGELCTCGKRGCWETVVGPQAVIADYQPAGDAVQRRRVGGRTRYRFGRDGRGCEAAGRGSGRSVAGGGARIWGSASPIWSMSSTRRWWFWAVHWARSVRR